jgi:hypothetical protein
MISLWKVTIGLSVLFMGCKKSDDPKNDKNDSKNDSNDSKKCDCSKKGGPKENVNVPEPLTGTFAQLMNKLKSNRAVKIEGTPTLAQLDSLTKATKGKITLTNSSPQLSGTAAQLQGVLPQISGYNGDVTISDAPNLQQLVAINNATSGAITLTESSQALDGTIAQLKEALHGITGYSGNVTISEDPSSAADLAIINTATSGAPTWTNMSVALTGTLEDLKNALIGIVNYKGSVTIDLPCTDAKRKSLKDHLGNNNITLNKINCAAK